VGAVWSREEVGQAIYSQGQNLNPLATVCQKKTQIYVKKQINCNFRIHNIQGFYDKVAHFECE
jgi:hypothetical protein